MVYTKDLKSFAARLASSSLAPGTIIMTNEKITYQGKIIEVVEYSPDGTRTFELARRAPGTRTIICVGDDILLTREHRHEIDGYDYRLPGGKVFDKLTEYNDFLSTNPTDDQKLDAARAGAVRELREEAGIDATSEELEFLYKSVCGATVEWDLYYFVIKVAADRLKKQQLEDGEDITLQTVSRDEARKLALDAAKMSEDRSAAVLLRFLESSND